MKKVDLNDLAARMEEQCGDWEHSEGLSEKSKQELLQKVEVLEGECREKKQQKNGHISIKKRYIAVFAAVLVLLMGLGVMGDRVWISDSNNLERESEVSTKVNNEEKENLLQEEEAVYQEIGELLGIAPLRFGYLPEGMVLDSYTVTESTGWAYINYLYEGKLICVRMTKQSEEASSNVQWDGTSRKLEDIYNEYGYEIEAYCVDEESCNYSASVRYANGYYDIFGSFADENEFFSILRGIFFKNL